MAKRSISISTIVTYIASGVFKVPGKIDGFVVSILNHGDILVHISREDIHSSLVIDLFDFDEHGFHYLDYQINELINEIDRVAGWEVG